MAPISLATLPPPLLRLAIFPRLAKPIRPPVPALLASRALELASQNCGSANDENKPCGDAALTEFKAGAMPTTISTITLTAMTISKATAIKAIMIQRDCLRACS